MFADYTARTYTVVFKDVCVCSGNNYAVKKMQSGEDLLRCKLFVVLPRKRSGIISGCPSGHRALYFREIEVQFPGSGVPGILKTIPKCSRNGFRKGLIKSESYDCNFPGLPMKLVHPGRALHSRKMYSDRGQKLALNLLLRGGGGRVRL